MVNGEWAMDFFVGRIGGLADDGLMGSVGFLIR